MEKSRTYEKTHAQWLETNQIVEITDATGKFRAFSINRPIQTTRKLLIQHNRKQKKPTNKLRFGIIYNGGKSPNEPTF
jgi:hypothetical protein